MWNSKRSTKLSLILTDNIFAAAIAVGIFLPIIAGWYIEATGKTQALKAVLITVCYCCLPFAAAALLTLRLLLKNILKSEVFVSQNVKFLRILSWCCVAVALIALASGYFYLPFYIVGTAAGFFALILRVIKNVFCAAIEIKNENELTI